jgi:hypothetical protein
MCVFVGVFMGEWVGGYVRACETMKELELSRAELIRVTLGGDSKYYRKENRFNWQN